MDGIPVSLLRRSLKPFVRMSSERLSFEGSFDDLTSIHRHDDTADTLSRLHWCTRSWIRWIPPSDRSSVGRIDGAYRRSRGRHLFVAAFELRSHEFPISDDW
jgi:hypothetical protein